MDFIIKNVKKKKDTSSTVKVVGYHNGEKVVVNNCHLVIRVSSSLFLKTSWKYPC